MIKVTRQTDPELAALVDEELNRQEHNNLKACKEKAEALIAKFPLYQAGSFDD